MAYITNNKLFETHKDKYIEIINNKISNMECPMCKNKSFILIEGYFVNTIQDEYKGINIGGRIMPTIKMCCSNCGYVSEHSLGILGLLDKTENKD